MLAGIWIDLPIRAARVAVEKIRSIEVWLNVKWGLERVLEPSAAVGFWCRTLERRLLAAIGRGIAVEMIRLRLNRAKRRLAEGKVPLKTVARETGFRSASHFSRVFTQHLGITPPGYGKEHRISLEGRR